jgi:hypothetical protein
MEIIIIVVWSSNSKYKDSWRVVQNMFVCSHIRPSGLNSDYSLQRYVLQTNYEDVRNITEALIKP